MKEARFVLFGINKNGEEYLIQGYKLEELLREGTKKLREGYTASIKDTLADRCYHLPLKYADIP